MAAKKLKRRVVIRRTQSRKPARGQFSAWQIRAALVAGLLFLAVGCFGGLFWLWHSGWFAKQGDLLAHKGLDLTRRAGFAVSDILIEGRNQTDQAQILAVLEAQKGAPILGFDPQMALTKLQTLPWVKSGVVERRLPGTIFVRLKEREPMAIWQHDNQLKLIDRDGHVLRDVTANETLALPHVVGEGAEKHAADLLSQLANAPVVLGVTRAAVRVSDRRWDLHMVNGIVVKLPEEHAENALSQLSKLIQDQNILDRHIVGLDLRLPDRMIVETDKAIETPKKPPHI